MNKARLTYRFDRTGLKEEETGAVAPKEPWNRDGKLTEARASEHAPELASDRETERAYERMQENGYRTGMQGSDAPSYASWEIPDEAEVREERKRREREAALRSAQLEPWAWTDEASRSREAGRSKPDRYGSGFDHGDRSKGNSTYGDRGSDKVVPLYEDEWRGLNIDRDWSNGYESDGPARDHSIHDDTIRIESLIRKSDNRSRHERNRDPYEEWNDHSVRSATRPHSSPSSRWETARYSDDYDGGADRDDLRRNPRGAATRYDSGSIYSGYEAGSRGPEIEESLLYPEGRRTNRRSLGWLKVAGSLLGALVLGGMLGYYVLTLFNGSSTADTKTPTDGSGTSIVQSNQGDNGNAAGADSTGSGEAAPVTAEANITLPEQAFVLLQNGKFSSAEAAAAAAGALDDSGYAAATEPGDFYFVYAGIASDRESARTLEEKLKANQFEVYAKEFKLPAVSRVEWSGDTLPLQNYLEETNRLTKIMAGITLVHLEEDSVTPLDAESLSSIKKAHQAWTEQASAVKGEAPASVKTLLQKMDNAINTAEKSLEAYVKNPSASLLNQAQSNLIQCLLAQKQLLGTLASN
ncbi:hypothetical protein [Gorillibacterium timonense]|uniref:hypothetical protein n=1 Tax=Gorillibacterium timonense TaxID=1689269 RepID=UPI00071C8306|nr:hypothetical protein [Gorillibacterium timonense]